MGLRVPIIPYRQKVCPFRIWIRRRCYSSESPAKVHGMWPLGSDTWLDNPVSWSNMDGVIECPRRSSIGLLQLAARKAASSFPLAPFNSRSRKVKHQKVLAAISPEFPRLGS